MCCSRWEPWSCSIERAPDCMCVWSLNRFCISQGFAFRLFLGLIWTDRLAHFLVGSAESGPEYVPLLQSGESLLLPLIVVRLTARTWGWGTMLDMGSMIAGDVLWLLP
jgi:hypothetical protein